MLYHNSIIPSHYSHQKIWLSFPQLTVKNPAGGSLETVMGQSWMDTKPSSTPKSFKDNLVYVLTI